MLLANILQSLSASVNSIWVGHYLGEAALAATSNAGTVMFLLIGAAFGVAMAATILVGQCVGASNVRDAKRVVGTSATFFATISVGISIAGLTLSEPLLASMKTPADSFPLAVPYMRVIFLALPSLYMYAFVMSVLRGAGDSKTPFYFMLLSVATDIALNPVFIFGFGPIPRLGIAGSALATVVAQTFSLTALVIHLYRHRHLLCLHKNELSMLRPDWAIVRTLVRKGIPISAHVLVLSFSGVLMITLVNRFGVETTAAFGASFQLWNLHPDTRDRRCHGSIHDDRSERGRTKVGSRRVDCPSWGHLQRSRHRLQCACDRNPGCTRVRIVLTRRLAGAAHCQSYQQNSYLVLDVFCHIVVLFGVTRATGAVIAPLLIATLSVLVVRFPLAETLLDIWHANAIWWSFPISSALEVVLAGLYYKYGSWRTAQLEIPLAREALGTHRT